MKKHTLAAVVGGALTVGALGVWYGPSMVDRDATADGPPAAVATPAPEPAKTRPAPRRANARKATEKTTIAPDVVATLPATQPDLQARLKPVLMRGTRMELAAEGFRDAHEFATVAHAARNTGVPFVVLKHRMLEEDKPLARAIRESKPELDAEHEVERARNAARFDIAVVTG